MHASKTEKMSIYKAYDSKPQEYLKAYQKDYEKYPDQRIRFDIVKSRLKETQVKTILDIGCGSGAPILKLLEEGYDCTGIDINPLMVEESKKLLKSDKQDDNRISINTLENTEIKQYDCLLNLGVWPHSKDDLEQIILHKKFLKQGGKVFIEMKNTLFSLFTFNRHTLELLNELMPDMPEDVLNYFLNKLAIKEPKNNDDYYLTYSRSNNPLTITKLFEDNGFRIDKIHFYHYHFIPPIFEGNHNEFNKMSLKLEKSDDWKGYFMASAFILEATLY